MRLDLMRPAEIRAAIAANLPLALPLGVLEYHGEHLPVGMDMLAVSRVLDRIEAARPDRLIVAPPFPYGAASLAVAGPEGSGTLQVGAEALVPFAEALFAGLLRIGFRNIHAVIHHQTENFAQGMPTDLSFRLGARKAIFAHLERERGEGWWGAPGMESYYGDHAKGENPFNWVRVHPLFDTAAGDYPFDHAGPGETALMLALAPEAVAMDMLDAGGHWFVRGAGEATAELGERGAAMAEARLLALMGLGAA
ncbi:MAG: creatininase family protein [Rhodobacteraceae bacterium]|nr:creatininase family protein [Paracoccaceae bacterium]